LAQKRNCSSSYASKCRGDGLLLRKLRNGYSQFPEHHQIQVRNGRANSFTYYPCLSLFGSHEVQKKVGVQSEAWLQDDDAFVNAKLAIRVNDRADAK